MRFYWDDNDRSQFSDPYGRSSLRRATKRNRRIHPCPTCGQANRLTDADKRKGYQCDACANAEEGIL